jgi:hypothetical protein
MLYALGYAVSTLTGSSSGRYKNLESKLQNMVIHARRDPVWFTVLYRVADQETFHEDCMTSDTKLIH